MQKDHENRGVSQEGSGGDVFQKHTGTSEQPKLLTRIITVLLLLSIPIAFDLWSGLGKDEPTAVSSSESTFYGEKMVHVAQANAQDHVWAAQVRDKVVQDAIPWMDMSYDDLWNAMFGPTIERSWMVWSDGYCPACQESVPMYRWVIESFKRPWKVMCPNCSEIFPKNDFEKYYCSGLDAHGVFDPKLADSSLLFNEEHPEPEDPLHRFGVDDGFGYREGDKVWRFIGAYLVYGQWKNLVLGGVSKLAAAYSVTGDIVYARKAGILLDRIADLYPSFDYGSQGWVYETKYAGNRGYVSVWHDACGETRTLVLAWDQIREVLRDDKEFVSFLSEKAKIYGLENQKASFDDIRMNIEQNILQDAIKHHYKIESNYPETDITLAIINAVLYGLDAPRVTEIIDRMFQRATAVDGLTGEKGLTVYSAIAPTSFAQFLSLCARKDPEFLSKLLERHPRIYDMYCFYIDTWMFEKQYPFSGDGGGLGGLYRRYLGVGLDRNPGINPSMFMFLWQLYKATGDERFVQIMYKENGYTSVGLPCDIYTQNKDEVENALEEIIQRIGTELPVESTNKEEWHLAVMKSGRGDDGRAFWLDYDSGGNHGHNDVMNLGLFAKGIDLMPDLGYPQVQYGGWGSKQASWYMRSINHNTVVIDGRENSTQSGLVIGGKTTLWADGQDIKAIRVSANRVVNVEQLERTVAMVDISEIDSYLIDVFRVAGGREHIKCMQSYYGTITTEGLALIPTEGFEDSAILMKNYRLDQFPEPGWSVDWKAIDYYGNFPKEKQDIHLRYTDLTHDAEALIADSWMVPGGFQSSNEEWLPKVMTIRRTDAGTLNSVFVGVIEPYETDSKIESIRRLGVTSHDGLLPIESTVAVEIALTNGCKDLLVSADAENVFQLNNGDDSLSCLVGDGWNLKFDGQLCIIRKDALGAVIWIAVHEAEYLNIDDLEFEFKEDSGFVEIQVASDGFIVVSGDL